MSILHAIALYIFHVLYALSEVISLVKSQLSTIRTVHNDDDDLFLNPKGKLPEHVAVAFIHKPSLPTRRRASRSELDQEEYVENMVVDAKRIVEWCSRLGISKLTLYDRDGERSY